MKRYRFPLLGRVLAVMLLAAGPLAGPLAPRVLAASLTVNSTADAPDAAPGDGVCATSSGSAACTLRAAIQEANALAGADSITLPAGTYTLTIAEIVNGTDATGDLDITADLTLAGASPSTTVVDGATSSVFDIHPGASVFIAGITVQHAYSAISNAGTLHLDNSTLRDNNAFSGGGGIYNTGSLLVINTLITGNHGEASPTAGGIFNTGTLEVSESTISDNTAFEGPGGILNRGTLQLNDSHIQGNTSQEQTGGIVNEGNLTLDGSTVSGNTGGISNGNWETDLSGQLLMIDSTVSRNSGQGISNTEGSAAQINASVISNNTGRGIGNDGGSTLTISNSTVSGNTNSGISNAGPSFYIPKASVAILNNVTIKENTSPDDGGGISNTGMLTLNDSTVISNTARRGGGGIFNTSAMTLTGSLVQANVVAGNEGDPVPGDEGAMYVGGGIYNNGGKLTLSNSTVSSNMAGPGNIGGGASGGGIYNYNGTLSLTGSTINDNAARSGESVGRGGGIYNSTNGTLLLCKSTVNGNLASAGDGGAEGGGFVNRGQATVTGSFLTNNQVNAGFGGAIANSGSVTISDSTIGGNRVVNSSAASDPNAGGGGIANSGTITMTNSSVSGNAADRDSMDDPILGVVNGGGVINNGTVTLTSSTVSDNRAADLGGGILNAAGTLKLTGSTVAANSVAGNGAGIYNRGNLTMSTSLVADNRASNPVGNNDGGGIYNDTGATLALSASTMRTNIAEGGITGGGDGGGVWNAGTATISSSTFNANQATNPAGSTSDASDGGGIYNRGKLTLTNSTVDGNTVQGGSGGGIVNFSVGTLTLANVTLSANDAAKGDGIYNGGSTVTVRNSILALNFGQDCSGSFNAQGYNLIKSKPSSCTLSGTTTGNKIGVDPKLGPLQNNGGATWTRALLTGSPAIDAGNSSTPGSTSTACPTRDQRGYTRPKDGNGDGKSRCDMGAFERQSSSGVAYTWGESDIADAPDPQSVPDLSNFPGEDILVEDASVGEMPNGEVPDDNVGFRVHLPYISILTP